MSNSYFSLIGYQAPFFKETESETSNMERVDTPPEQLNDTPFQTLAYDQPQAIKNANSTSSSPQPAAAAAVQTFWQWLSNQDVVSAKTPAKPAGLVPQGLGLVAQRDISRNEVVLEIPKKLWIDPDVVAASEIGNVCSGLKPWVSVALFLIREKFKEDSTWRP
ncbi:hypothetical protein OIU78_006701 [Salix suchowensis]|nr:hypothetical protein OIU78_006701 [Salix suchowensis]